MKKAIVTGATGFIGQYLVNELLQEGYDVFSVVRKESNSIEELKQHQNHTIISTSLEELTAEDFPKEKYNVFFHLGWSGVNREKIDDEEIHEKSYCISLKCLSIAQTIKCECFCDAGTRAEYGELLGIYDEEKSSNPVEAYAKWKLSFYRYAYEFCQNKRMEYVHFRLFSVIGVGDHPWSLIATACEKLKRNEKMKMGSCQQLWNFMAVEDAVRAMRLVYENHHKIKSEDNRIYNIASYDTRILRSFVEEIYVLAKSNSELEFQLQCNSKMQVSIFPSIEKLTSLTVWKSQITFGHTIENILRTI